MSDRDVLSSLEFHALLATTEGPQYGYAIKNAVEKESEGVLSPGPGTLYRVIGRLIGRGLLAEVDPPTDEAHPGLSRRYYQLTPTGVVTLRSETARRQRIAALAALRVGALDQEAP